jgi:hypothetical protein
MYFTPAIASLIIVFATGALAAPVPQLAGEGAAANSILSDTDNGVGYGTEDALDNTANLITSLKGGVPALPARFRARRQLAGEGAAADSILSDTDNGVGYGTENALDNTANLISSTKGSVPAVPARFRARRQLAGEGAAADSILSDTDNGVGYGTEDALDNTANLITSIKGGSGTASTGTGASNPPPPPPPPGRMVRRQGDKISNGVGAVGNALGVGAVTDPIQAAGDNADGSLTSAAANAGASVGSAEETTLEGVGSAVPKFRRQGDKISNGVGAVGNALGVGAVTDPIQAAGDNADGSLTSAAANAGASVGSAEESTLEGIGSAVPKFRRQGDKISNGVGAVGNAAGVGAVTDPIAKAGDGLDGTSTSAAANIGADIGSAEEASLEEIGSAVPK